MTGNFELGGGGIKYDRQRKLLYITESIMGNIYNV